jgi:hypothetical protein
MNNGENHPDLALIIHDLNNNINLGDLIVHLIKSTTQITCNPHIEIDEDMKEFLDFQWKIIETLKLFPLRQLN